MAPHLRARAQARGGLLLCVLLCLHGGADSQTALEGDFGQPTFGMPNSYNMAQHSLQLGGKQGSQASPEASLSSYDQQILAKGPPGVGAGAGEPAAGASRGPMPYASATSGCESEREETRGRGERGGEGGGGARGNPTPRCSAADSRAGT